ncbi:glycine zipper 2TM domain-containing protein [Parendozoicomonas sp. Alg238-R29]|uniref:glycine zipper 2TM domain-containing protein n=1 Tax=Parendozoicomonas sp. Alg238-R29 TaxID=2993446 RepID=UPI00248E3084|nr:glycine zipper 2TM domain-containing protein [Parendozoicomonas sp. Alg238-R29]
MKLSRLFSLMAAGTLTLLLGGCLADLTGSNYDRGEARTVQAVQFGEIVDIETVKVDGTKSGVGAVAGAATGGLAGSTIGGGKGKSLAAIAGAVAGGVFGNYAERKVTEGNGLNLTVKLDNGSFISIVQQVEQGNSFRVGDRVKVYSHGRTSRVVRSN